MKVRLSKILIGILSLAVMAAATMAGREYAKRLKLQEFHQEQREKYVEYLERCVLREHGISGIVDAEKEFLNGRKGLIRLGRGSYDSSDFHVPGLAGSQRHVSFREGALPEGLRTRLRTSPIPSTSGKEACLIERYALDYNLTMLRLLGLREVGEASGGGSESPRSR